MVAALSSEFNPVEFIVDVLPDMNQWQFPLDSWSIGICGTLDWLHQEDNLFPSTSTPSHYQIPLSPTPNDDCNVLTEFFPDAHFSLDSTGREIKENIQMEKQAFDFQSEQKVILDIGAEQNYANSLFSTTANRDPSLHPDPTFVFPPLRTLSPLQWSYNQTSPLVQTPPYTPQEYSLTPPTPRKPLTSVSNTKANRPRLEEVCTNCKTKQSPMWRWNSKGERECNACNLYESHNNKPRPPALWKDKILRRRKRNPKQMDTFRTTPY